MSAKRAATAARVVAAVVLVISFGACDEEVTDLSLNDSPFSIYGFVNPGADTQFVRVFAVTDRPSAHEPGPLNAEVRYVDLATGASYPARDSTAAFGEERSGHVFWMAFRAAYDRGYRVEVRGDGGITAHATVHTPPPSEVVMLEGFTRFDPEERGRIPVLPVMVRGTGGLLQRIEAVYHVEAHNIGRNFHAIPYDASVETRSNGWQVELDLVQDYHTIYAEWEEEYRLHEDELRRQGVECCRVEFYGLEVRAAVVDSNWSPPGGVYDPELLVQPGTMDNVENGFGFIGAGYEESSEIGVPRCFQYWAGYVFADNPCTAEDYCRYRGEQCGE